MSLSLGSLGPYYNIANLSSLNREIASSTTRLSTGSILNSASDNSANIGIAATMKAEIAAATIYAQNASVGMATIATADEVLSEMTDIVNRIRELAVQAQNSATSSTDRTTYDSEASALTTLLTSLSADTKYNGTALLDGTYAAKTFQIGSTSTSNVSVTIPSMAGASLGAYLVTGTTRSATAAATSATANDTSASEDVTIGTTSIEATANESAAAMATKINAVTPTTGVSARAETYALLETSDSSATTYTIKINDTATASFSIVNTDPSGAVSAINAISSTTGVTAEATSAYKVLLHDATGADITIENTDSDTGLSVTAVKLDATTTQGSAVSLAASGGNDSTRVIGTISLSSDESFSVTQSGTASQGYFATGTSALSALSTISLNSTVNAASAVIVTDNALKQISSARGTIGAASTHLEFSSFANERQKTELASGLASISDADIALEAARLAKAQMLKQATLALQSFARSEDDLIIALLKQTSS